MSNSFRAGYAEVEWTPEPGHPLMGQMHERIATHKRDPLCACAAALQSGEETVVIVTVDVCQLDNEFASAAQGQWAARTGLDPHTLIIHTTHTHVAPLTTGAPEDARLQEFRQRLHSAVLDAAIGALEKLEDVEVFADCGYLEYMGWNRRAMYEDGTSRMYGNSTQPGFTGIEGPRDGALPAIWTCNAAGEVTGVITSFSTHPNTMEAEYFYSADIPGAVRKYLRQALGGNVGAVHLTAAAGNTAPSWLDSPSPEQNWRGERGVERSGQYVAGEALKLIATNAAPMSEPQLKLQHAEIPIPLRPWPEPGEPGYPDPGSWSEALWYYDKAREAWPERIRTISPLKVNLNVIRIGDAAICTNPAELFVEFGLDIRGNSPARVTLISELSDGYCGYVPTAKAFSRGGYETWTTYSSQLVYNAGNIIVDQTQILLKKAFEEKTDKL